VTGVQENEDPRGEAAVRVVLVCSWTAVENHNTDEQGRAQEGPEEVGELVRERQEVSRVGGGKQVVMALVTVCVRSRLHNQDKILRGTRCLCAIPNVSLGQGVQGRKQDNKLTVYRRQNDW
jgi:hypothetical protein